MTAVSTVTVLGAGYVGLTTAALLAHAGYKVYAIEPNKERLDVIKQGRSFFFEEGLDPVIETALQKGTLIATDSYAEAIPSSQVVFSCVGTPDNPDGSSNLTYVFSSAEKAAKHMQPGTIYVQKSTVPVGTGRRVEALFANKNLDIPYVSNPEFLRESTALYDTLYFDRVVAGGDNQQAVDTILDLYRQLEAHRDDIASLAKVKSNPRLGSYISTSLESAELIKVTSNAFLALKISFANSIAKLADKVGADITEVMDAVGADERIGRAFLNAGRGYGGGCFPKDVSGLIASGQEHGIDLDIMKAAQAVNQSMPGYAVKKLEKALGSLKDKRITVLGLAFKPGTSDIRKSPGINIVKHLREAGSQVTCYDPEARDEAAKELPDDVILVDSLEDSLKAYDAIAVATDWPEFKSLKGSPLAHDKVIIDAVNMFSASDFTRQNMHYLGVGRR